MIQNTPKTLPRLFQWAGGKTKMIKHYTDKLPDHGPIHVEPFAGGAALFAHVAATREAQPKSLLGDTNREIMKLYQTLRDTPEPFLQHVTEHDKFWKSATPSERKRFYYDLRQVYWRMAEGVEATATLYTLMKTSFNGIWQTCKESKGRFATPVGLVHKPGGFLQKNNVMAWSHALQNTDLHTGSFETLNVPENAFVFCDPPYRDSFTHYSTGFNDNDQKRLVHWCRDLHHKTGCTVWLANREAEDGFFETHAPDAERHIFPVVYTAGRRKRTESGFEAKPAQELLLIWKQRKNPT